MAKRKPAGNALNKEPRDMTAAERREEFLKNKEAMSKDWRVVKEGEKKELVPFDILALDHGLQLWGLARKGTVYHIHGDEGSSKSSLTYTINRNYQRAAKEPVAIFDFEGTYDSWYAGERIGLDESLAFIKQPGSIEDAVKDAVDLMDQGVRMFTFDSIPRMRNIGDDSYIRDGSAFKPTVGLHARAIENFYNIMLPRIYRVNGTMLMVNQTRARIEMSQEAQSAAKGYATVTNLNYTLPGGRANRFAVSAMIETKLVKAWKPGKHEDPFILEAEALRGEEYLAHEVRLRTLKNKVTGTGYRQATIWLRPSYGFDENISIREYARELGLIANYGKRYFVGESIDNAIKVYDDKASAIEDLVNDPNEEVLAALKELIIAKITEDPSAVGTMDADEVDDDTQRYLAGEENQAAAAAANAVVDDDL